MSIKNLKIYEILVNIAYWFYLLLGIVWFAGTLYKDSKFNPIALLVVAVFGFQMYYRHKIANLIIGVLSMFFSFFMLMEVMNRYNLLAKNADFTAGAKFLVGMAVLSIFLSGILIFNYGRVVNGERDA